MSKRLTTEEFISKAKLVHGDKYNYNLVKYVNTKTKIKIICPIHGEFEQVPNYHLSKCGCNKCGIAQIIVKNSSSKINFIEKANIIHNGKYDYSKTIYTNAHNKIKIICPYHGEFLQKPHNHLNDKGCSICAGMDRNLNNEKIIKKFKLVHNNNKYDYSLVNYINSWTKIKIICKEHGIFEQTPNSHNFGAGCPLCVESKGENKIKNLLSMNNINFISQKRFLDCKNIKPLPFDFYLPDYNICIEFNGKQHYIIVPYWGGEKYLKLQQTRDKIKVDYCFKNNIKLIIIKHDEDIYEKLNSLFVGVTIIT
jgi:hypothetical protein